MTNQSNNRNIKGSSTTLFGAFVIATMAVIATTLLARAVLDGRPIEVPTATDSSIQCASYTPSHDARIRYNMQVPIEVIRQDLRILSKDMHCIRTYTVNEGLDQVPTVARELGMKVMLGLWISSNTQDNAREIAHGIEVARANKDVIESIIVGNEVLLRRELTGAQLHDLLRQVRNAVDLPVTYADVWEFWLRNSELAETASFITIHILPYWEDNPVPIDHALDHIRSIYAKVQTVFPNKHIFIGETGWPSAGRQRMQSQPSLVNEARFIREFVDYAANEHVSYNIIEAFDQPWKRIQEGTVGGTWGLYDANGQRKFAFSGSVIPQPNWYFGPALGTILAALSLMLVRKYRSRTNFPTQLFITLAALAAGCVLLMQWRYLIAANRNTLEWVATTTWSLSGWAAFLACCAALVKRMDGRDVTLVAIPGINETLHAIGHGAQQASYYGVRLLSALRFLVLFGAGYTCLGLVFEGRGRDFPLSLLGLPVTAFALHALFSTANRRRTAVEEWLLSFVLLSSSGFVLWNETWVNQRAVLWCLLSSTFAISVIIDGLRTRNATSI
jgi:exo-beta-1,3-glucanase (GH17 family)